MICDDLRVGWQPAKVDEDEEIDVPPIYNILRNIQVRLAPDNGSEFEHMESQGIPEYFEINSDAVSSKALAELAMAAVRITKRHYEFVEEMAGFEEAARRVLKRAPRR